MRRETYSRRQSLQAYPVSASQTILALAILSGAQSLAILWLLFA